MGLFRRVSEINGDVTQNKITIFFNPRVFNVMAEGVFLSIGYRRLESKKLE